MKSLCGLIKGIRKRCEKHSKMINDHPTDGPDMHAGLLRLECLRCVLLTVSEKRLKVAEEQPHQLPSEQNGR